MQQLYLSLLEGNTPRSTKPLLTTSDPALIEAFVEAVRQRVAEGLADGEARRVLRLLDEEREGEGQ